MTAHVLKSQVTTEGVIMAAMKDIATDIATIREAIEHSPGGHVRPALAALESVEKLLEELLAGRSFVRARDLLPGDCVDLEPAYRADPQGDDLDELMAGVHWSIFEGATVDAVTTVANETTIEHDFGVMIVDADTLLPRIGTS